MADLNTSVRFIKGVGDKRARAFARLDIQTLGDLVSHFPRQYDDRTLIKPIGMALPHETACVYAVVAAEPKLSRARTGLSYVRLRIADDTGSIDVTFFNQPYVVRQLKPGKGYFFFGKLGGSPGRLTMVNPIYEGAGGQMVTGRIVPVYRLTAGISQRNMMACIRHGLDACDGIFPDFLPKKIREKYNLAQAPFSYENIHFPADFAALRLSRERLIFEELFVLACAMNYLRGRRIRRDGIRFADRDLESFFARLPFAPTGAQRRVVAEAAADMRSGGPMNRIIQGDVGSGKTLAAAACLWLAHKNGFQSAFMAPTEILARQHFATLSAFLEPHGMALTLLTGSMTAKRKRQIKSDLALGQVHLIIGTHALLTEDVGFQNLALVVTDEQHRFGVGQRGALSGKGDHPHVLVMSATPIPRTLALVIYGDLDVSIIDEMPPGRRLVETFAVNEDMRPRINRFIRRLVGEGRQVFIVCPMVEESEVLAENVKSAREHAAVLQRDVFPDLAVGCIHGKMKAADKDAVMTDFLEGRIDILVSTTVIEVGVDAPNAALMVVENAERFGLSQLHQLRGRVGRGSHQSYCVLFSDSDSQDTRARLDIMRKTSDGFKISEEDLKIRGPGDFLGARQHGLPQMRIADLSYDIQVLKSAQQAAGELLDTDPQLKAPENSALLARIKALLEAEGVALN